MTNLFRTPIIIYYFQDLALTPLVSLMDRILEFFFYNLMEAVDYSVIFNVSFDCDTLFSIVKIQAGIESM